MATSKLNSNFYQYINESGMIFLRRLKNDLIVSLFRTLIARGVAALGGILLMSILGRQFGPAGVGVFALARFCGLAFRTPDYPRWRLWFSALACAGLLLMNFPVAGGIIVFVLSNYSLDLWD